jgi:CRISPR-associated protein Csm3
MININYSIELLSPLRIQTGIGTATLDNTVVKDAEGKVYVPGSSIKGKMRSIFYRFADALGYALHDRGQDASGCYIYQNPCMVCRIFGSPHWDGQLHFDNALLSRDMQTFIDYLNRVNERKDIHYQQPFGVQARTNVAINRKFRVAQPNLLFTTECVDKELSFSGQISGEIRDRDGDLSALALVLASLQEITHLGADRSRGMGRCKIFVQKVVVNGQEKDVDILFNEIRIRED